MPTTGSTTWLTRPVIMVVIASLRPGAQDIEFVAGALVEQGEATAAELAADLEIG